MPELDCFQAMLNRLYRTDMERMVMSYEMIRNALQREIERRLSQPNMEKSASIEEVYESNRICSQKEDKEEEVKQPKEEEKEEEGGSLETPLDTPPPPPQFSTPPLGQQFSSTPLGQFQPTLSSISVVAAGRALTASLVGVTSSQQTVRGSSNSNSNSNQGSSSSLVSGSSGLPTSHFAASIRHLFGPEEETKV